MTTAPPDPVPADNAPADWPLPSVQYALPLGSENRWSDLLAAMMATDPQPIQRLLGLNASAGSLTVQREEKQKSADRPDILLRSEEKVVAVIEVKVLSGLGHRQLQRYHVAVPGAERYAVIYPARLAVTVPEGGEWSPYTWDEVLAAYERSGHPWVRQTARAWAQHLQRALPKVSCDTVWNDMVEGENFVLAMRARLSWLYSQHTAPEGISQDLIGSSSGVSWVMRFVAPTSKPGYSIVAEVEERLPTRSYPKYVSAVSNKALGPSAKVLLMQEGVCTSADFDWDYLRLLWPQMRANRDDWVTRSARPRAAHDRAGHARAVAEGMPRFVGIGFGEAQARLSRACLFGARIQYAPNVTLAQMAQELPHLVSLVQDLATLAPPKMG